MKAYMERSGEWSTSRSGRFISGIHWIGGRVGPRVGSTLWRNVLLIPRVKPRTMQPLVWSSIRITQHMASPHVHTPRVQCDVNAGCLCGGRNVESDQRRSETWLQYCRQWRRTNWQTPISDEYRANILRLKARRVTISEEKKIPAPLQARCVAYVTWKQHEQFTGRPPLLRSSTPFLSTRQARIVTSFDPHNLVLQRQTCGVHTRGLNKSGVQFNFRTLHSVPLDLYTEITVQLTAKIR